MALELLVQKIHDDTAREVAAIRQEADAKVTAIEADVTTRAESMYKRELEALRGKLNFLAQQEYSQREIEVRRGLLREREILLDEVRRQWMDWLHSLPPEAEKSLLAQMLKRGRTLVPAGTLRASARTLELLGKAEGFATELDADVHDGFRLCSENGRIVVDLTYGAMAEEFWARQRPALAAKLFGDALLVSGDIQ